ncbi:MAG TPA: response regulator, partial [Vicinamibacterales bacterium]|nr:response regulator [Vicinamibacterales bacterium]
LRRALKGAAIEAEITEADGADAAIAALASQPFDCVILDYQMPGTDGLQVLQAFRNTGVRSPVIMLTGQGDEQTAVELMKAGAADYIGKGQLTPERLSRSLRHALALYRSEEARRQLLAREKAAREDAQAANHAKDEFLATLSHELRTPLNAILGWSQILRNGKGRQDVLRGLEVIERNARAQTQLIEDLLDMSRITSGTLRLDVQPVSPVTIVEAAIETLKPAFDAKGIRLETFLDPSIGPIAGDPGRLQQVVWNLLSNGVKFTPKGGKVQVVLQRINSQIEIQVADTGAGIRPEFLPHLFERFRQGDHSTTRKHGGLGLGLSIVKSLVELHGGSVAASSPGEGQGTTVTVSLPLLAVYQQADAGGRVHPASELPQAPAAPSRELEGIRVLVVDDQPDARDLLTRVLEDGGAEVVAASSGEEALARIVEQAPDVLLSDIGMPEMDGFELLRRVRSLSPAPVGRTPAIALTAFSRSEERTRALRAGFVVHVTKPVDPSELVATVASVAGRLTPPH